VTPVAAANRPDLIARVAAEIGVEILGRASGGENGAAFVRDDQGRDLVLKASPGVDDAAAWARGVAIARALHRTGYPVPDTFDTGTAPTAGATWSLQAALPGAVPDCTTVAHVHQLVALAERHAGQAPRPDPDWPGAFVRGALACATRVAAGPPSTRRWGDEIGAALRQLADDPAAASRQRDVVHFDFHHRNYVADGERVTGVFDWEGARSGDWRFDLATLAFWARLAGPEMAPDARVAAVDRAVAVCPAPALALYALGLSARTLDFYLARRPDLVEPTAEAITERVAAWWR
jgi:aminoglycoside phosphotransferase (APT) family kinase protein